MTVRNLQGRYANIKTVLSPETVVARILDPRDGWPNATVVWATHDEPGKAKHCHLVVRWPSVTRWTALAVWLHKQDGHEYTAPAGSWRRSVRYLLHLDNPEKALIPREALGSHNIDETELSQLLGSQRLPILESLILAESLPLHQRFAFLVCERGHAPSEVSAALRCMLDLERWHDTRTCRSFKAEDVALPAMPPASAARHADKCDADAMEIDLDADADFNFGDLERDLASDAGDADAMEIDLDADDAP